MLGAHEDGWTVAANAKLRNAHLSRHLRARLRLSAASLHGAAWTDTLVALKNMEEEEGTTTPDSPSSVPDTSGGASSSSFEAPQGPDGMRERKVGGQESQVMTVN